MLRYAALTLCAVACRVATADTAADANGSASLVQQFNNELAVSLGATGMRYEELDTHHQTASRYLDSDTGTQPVVQGSWSWQGAIAGVDNVYTALEADYARGHTAYSGYSIDLASSSGVGAPLTESYTGMQFNAGARLGRSIQIGTGDRFQVTPYLAYQYHHWTRNALERYENQAAGIGVLCQYMLTPALLVQTDLSLEQTFDARVHASGLPPEVLGSRPQDSMGIGLDMALSRQLHVRLDYRVERFGYGGSAAVSGYFDHQYGLWFEPASRTLLQTVTVGLAWSL